jgi:hypothetical protein
MQNRGIDRGYPGSPVAGARILHAAGQIFNMFLTYGHD